MRRVALLIAVSLAAPVLALPAQDTPTAGQRVRIKTTSSLEWLVGTLSGADDDSLRLWIQGSDSVRTVAVARSSVMQFEVSRGQHSNAGRGAIAGGAIFGTLGLLAGASCASDQHGWLTCSSADAVRITVLAALEGAGFGALVGAVSHSERWQSAPLSPSRVTVAPYRTGLRVSIAF